MKTKHLILTLALMMIFGAAQVQAQGLRGLIRNAVAPKQEQPAGITPEAVIGQAPDLPAVATLASGGDLADFYEQIAALREKMRETTDRISAGAQTVGRADVERIARQQTGRSVAELQNMSEAEQQAMAQQMAQRQLAAAGMGNMSLEQLRALEGKSDEEIGPSAVLPRRNFRRWKR
jgi:hypothetical protein